MTRQMLSWVIVPEAGIATIEAASGEAMHGAVAPHPDDLEFVVGATITIWQIKR